MTNTDELNPLKRLQISNARKLDELFAKSGFKVHDKWDFKRLKAEPYMDLCVDKLFTTKEGIVNLALAHNGRQNGDVMADPDMGVTYIPASANTPARMEVTHYQNDYMGIYHEAGKVPQMSMERFMSTWLNNLLEQGHQLEEAPKPAPTTATTAEDRWALKPAEADQPTQSNHKPTLKR